MTEPAPQAPAQEADLANQPQSKAEWISLSISTFLLAVVVGLVIYLWASDHKQQPPILEVTTSQVRQAQDQYYVPFVVQNTGGETAASVQVMATLTVNGTLTESGEQTIDFLSSQERSEGAFMFTQDPRQGALSVRVASYRKK